MNTMRCSLSVARVVKPIERDMLTARLVVKMAFDSTCALLDPPSWRTCRFHSVPGRSIEWVAAVSGTL